MARANAVGPFLDFQPPFSVSAENMVLARFLENLSLSTSSEGHSGINANITTRSIFVVQYDLCMVNMNMQLTLQER